MKKAAPSAASWGCLSSTFSCLCENRWFADGYNSCVRQSCGFTDTYDAKSQFETQCNSTFTRGQQRVVEGRRLTLLPELLQRDLVSYKVTETTFVPAVDTNPPNAFTLLPADPASTPLPISAVAQMTTTPVSIPFTTSALGTPSSSPIFSSTSITAAPSTQTSPPATGGVSQSAKIVVGLGVPLAIILLALIVYALYRYHRTRQKSRGSHAANIAITEPNPAVDNAVQEKKRFVHAGAVQPRYKDDDPVSEGRELHGQHIPPYSRELEGSPGYGRKELPG